jgi:hypothetical protein
MRGYSVVDSGPSRITTARAVAHDFLFHGTGIHLFHSFNRSINQTKIPTMVPLAGRSGNSRSSSGNSNNNGRIGSGNNRSGRGRGTRRGRGRRIGSLQGQIATRSETHSMLIQEGSTMRARRSGRGSRIVGSSHSGRGGSCRGNGRGNGMVP